MSPDANPDPQLPRFQRQQLAFAGHLRDPLNTPMPDGIEPRRMAVYAEILYNGLNEQLSGKFPVLHEIIPGHRWHAIVRDFLAHHRAGTPLFTEIALEFLEYLQAAPHPAAGDWPFMLELAHYEYVELAVALSDADERAQARARYDPNGDLLAGRPVLAPTAWNLSYRYPVHRIGPDYLPAGPPAQATHLVVYRDRLDDVHFLEINAVTQRLLTLMQAEPGMTGEQILQRIAEELRHTQPATVLQAGSGLFNGLRERHVILGSR